MDKDAYIKQLEQENARHVMWSEYSHCVRLAVCRDEALLNICVMRVVVIWMALLLQC